MKNILKIEQNIPLAQLTTLKIGGKARYFFTANSENELILAVKYAISEKLPLFILGGGSNVLISDRGFKGLVVQINIKGISINQSKGNNIFITAQAGEDWDNFVEFCVKRNLAGIECLSGIPGLVGGTPIQNVGAYGQEVSETIKSVRVFDRKYLKVRELINSECKFSYRKSIFNSEKKERFIVLSVSFILLKNGPPKLIYRDLMEKFPSSEPDLQRVREAVCQIRAEKGMLVRQGGLDSQSAGSFFKNPVVSSKEFEEIKKKIEKLELLTENETIPFYNMGGNRIKIPAAWLIERSGFKKGYQRGAVGLSTKHTLALTNRGTATAQDLLDLKKEIQNKINENFGIVLNPEPNFIGFSNKMENR
jgi:UDP-N-acetylmuramate dehydrogenase